MTSRISRGCRREAARGFVFVSSQLQHTYCCLRGVWRYLYSFWRNSRTWHGETHRIVQQKYSTCHIWLSISECNQSYFNRQRRNNNAIVYKQLRNWVGRFTRQTAAVIICLASGQKNESIPALLQAKFLDFPPDGLCPVEVASTDADVRRHEYGA